MNKVIDFIALRMSAFLLIALWLIFILENVWLGLIISATITVSAFFIWDKIELKRKKGYGADKLDKELALGGSAYTLQLFKDTFYPSAELVDGKFFTADKVLYYSSYRFSAAGSEDIATAYRYAQKIGADKITLICKSTDRSALILASSLPVEFNVIKIRTLYTLLKKADALPPLTIKKAGKLPKISAFADIVFNKSNLRYYLISGFMLGIMYLFVPYKAYYLTISSITLALALITAIRH